MQFKPFNETKRGISINLIFKKKIKILFKSVLKDDNQYILVHKIS